MPKKSDKEGMNQRLSAALRANLKRRKAALRKSGKASTDNSSPPTADKSRE